MKRVLKRSWMIFIVALAFLATLAYLILQTFVNSSAWVDQPYNGHVSGANGLLGAGQITDRNGEVLAQTVDGKRVYHEDKATRTALLHTIGDNSLYISTAIQSQYRSQLTGYNFVWGINLPDSFKTSSDMMLTVDAETCKVAYNSLKDYDSGSCVIYNYKTGEILCSVSVKSYDPQAPPEINENNEDKWEGVYLDNTLSSAYTPGSIFKVVTSACAIDNIEDIEERTWTCNGRKEIGGSDITCVGAHGTVNLDEAFGSSCNIVFAELAVELGAEKMTETANAMGINSSFTVNGINTKKGNYDVSDADQNQLAWSGVGQYTNAVNPMGMAIMCGAIANGGTPKLPYMVKGESGNFWTDLGLSSESTEGERMLSVETSKRVEELMRYAVVNDYGDTMFGDLTVCAKTGTGETLTGEGEDKNDGWMIGFSTDEDCPLAFACVVRGTDRYGYATAGQVAKNAMIQASKSLKAEK